MAKVVVAWTTPFVAKRVPLKEPRPRVVVVALVTVRLPSCERPETYSAVCVALVATRLVAKTYVEVACEVVALRAEKSWKVEEPVTKRLRVLTRPVLEMEKSVVVAVSLVEEEMLKTSGLMGEEEARKMERLAMGEVVPTPTFPNGSIKKSVAEVEPIANGMLVPDAFTLSVAKGDVVPTPTLLAKVLLTVVDVATR
jgi:hypothetical protein